MKRFFALIILMMYSIANVGIGVHTHWCGGKISSVKISFSTDHTCSCGPKMEMGCCKNKFVYSKQSVDHLKCANTLINNNKIDIKPVIITQYADFQIQPFVLKEFSQYHAPPFKTKLKLFLVNSIFRI